MTLRRATHVDVAVSYAAVGASNDAHLLRYPPEGTTAYQEEVRLGSGSERFVTASSALMTWGAQRGIGISVEDIAEGTGAEYVGLAFAEDGSAEAPPQAAEAQYSPTGERFLTAGMTATLEWPGKRESRRIRVISTVDRPRQIGFTMGTLDTQGAVGEERFTVEMREDGSVWAQVRGFLSAPESGLLGMRGRAMIRLAQASSVEQLKALRPSSTISPDSAESAEGSQDEKVTGTATEPESESDSEESRKAQSPVSFEPESVEPESVEPKSVEPALAESGQNADADALDESAADEESAAGVSDSAPSDAASESPESSASASAASSADK